MKLLALILSFQIIIAPVAFAQTETTTDPNTKTWLQQVLEQRKKQQQGVNNNAETKANEEQNKQMADANKVELGSNAEYDKASNSSSGGFGSYAQQGLTISQAIIGSNIITQCTFGMKIPSIALFWAGTIAYIASELTSGGKDQNKDQNANMAYVDMTADQIKALKSGGGGDVQLAAIEKRLADEKRTEKFVKDRVMWLTAVAAIYAAAAAAAAYEEMSGFMAGEAAGTSTCFPISSGMCSGPHYAACIGPMLSSCYGAMKLGYAAVLPNFANPASVPTEQAACGAAGPFAPACMAHLTAYLAIAYANCMPFPGPAIALGIGVGQAIAAAYSMGITSASGNAAASSVVLLFGIIKYFIPTLATQVMAAYNYPIPRAVTFGVMAGLVATVIADLNGKLSNTIKPNIDKLTAVRDAFLAETTDSTGLAYTETALPRITDGVTLPTPTPNPDQKDPPLPGANPIKPLAGGTMKVCQNKDNQVEFSETCGTPMSLGKVTFNPTGFTNSASLKSTSDMAIDMANHLASGNVDKARGLASQIGSNLNSVRNGLSEIQNKLNKDREANGQKKFDYEGQSKTQLAKLNEEFKKAAGSNSQLAAVANTDLKLTTGSIGSSAIGKASDETKGTNLAPEVPIKGAIAINPSASKGTKPEEASAAANGSNGDPLAEAFGNLENAGEDSQLTEEEKMIKQQEALRAAHMNGYVDIEERFKKYNSKDGISPLADLSIFKQISYRYNKSLDKVLVRKKKIAAPSK